MLKFHDDHQFSTEHHEMCNAIEELVREADHRSLGGMQTEDQQFAHRVREALKDVLEHLDRADDLMKDVIRNSNDEINETEYSLQISEKKLSKIESWIKGYRRLDGINDIINGGDPDDVY